LGHLNYLATTAEKKQYKNFTVNFYTFEKFYRNLMKHFLRKSIVLTLISLSTLLANGQITISSSNMPSANDTIRYSVVQIANGIDFKTSGANKTWDFTKLKPTSQALYEYKASSSTPYILNFGFSAIGLKIADSIGGGQVGFKKVYNFFKKSTSKWEAVGIGFELSMLPLPQAGKHTNSDEIYQFPLDFNDRDSVAFALKIPLTAVVVNIGNYFQDGNRINTVDGWGKISTPYQSDIECIRLKSVITETDSLSIAITGQTPINFAFPNNRVEYKWLSKTEKIAVLEVSGTEIGGNFTPTTIRYRDNFKSNLNPLAPVVNFTADKTVATKGEIITLTDNSTNSPLNYTWTITPAGAKYENGTTNRSKNPQVSFSNSGKYTVKLVAANAAGNGTITKTDYIKIDDNASLKNVNPNRSIAYPNPANENVNIEIGNLVNQNIKVFVFDMEGKLVQNTAFTNAEHTIVLNTSFLANGSYNAVIISDSSIFYSTFSIQK
jgi:PKD repeat protein